MGIHTSIYRVREKIPRKSEYEIKLFKNGREVRLYQPVQIREEFYLGKSANALNFWLYKRIKSQYEEWGDNTDDIFVEEMYGERLGIDDIKDLLKDVNIALQDLASAGDVLPKYDVENEDYENPIAQKDKDYRGDEYYLMLLKNAQKLLQKLVDEDRDDLVDDYILDIG